MESINQTQGKVYSSYPRMMPGPTSRPDRTRHERQEVRCIPPKFRKFNKFPGHRKRQAIVKMGTRPPRWLKCPRKSTIIAGI